MWACTLLVGAEAQFWKTWFRSNSLTAVKIATGNYRYHWNSKFALVIMPTIPYIGVVFPFIGLLSLDRYNFLFLDDFEGNANI